MELCAWQLFIPGGQMGVAHRPSREEVLLVMQGKLTATIDGVSQLASTGDVVLVPPNAEFTLDAGPEGVTAWVTTTIGLTAMLPDGSRLTPPWAH